jgi:hypothetical protein
MPARSAAKADLVVARKVGREKFHYLNPVPIARIHERWVAKFATPFVSALSALKLDLEEGNHRGQTATSA